MIPLLSGLPPGFPAAVLIVVHLPTHAETRLHEVLGRRSPLPVHLARSGRPVERGQVQIAPPGYHLEIADGQIQLVAGPRENGFRPAIDPLFRTAARAGGDRVIAVLLSGGLLDGVSGLMAVRNAGGLSVVQDPGDAVMGELPQRAIELAGADHVVSASEMSELILRLVAEPLPPRAEPPPGPGSALTEQIAADFEAQRRGGQELRLAPIACPDCGGTLWQDRVSGAVSFRCHVGHSYGVDRLQDMKGEELEAALWTAVRIFRERGLLSRQLSEQERGRDNLDAATRYGEQAEVAERNARVIVDRLLTGS